RKLWEQPVVDHEDSDHRIDRAGILPRPKRQIPIWLGGFSEAAYDRAARIADGFLFSGRTQTEDSRGGPKPTRFKTRRGSRQSFANWEGMPMHLASSPSSNTAGETTNGLAILRHGAKLEGVTCLS